MSEMTSPSTNREMLAVLEPDQLVAAKRTPLPRRRLTRMESLTLWSLRLYLIVVMGVLMYQVFSR